MYNILELRSKSQDELLRIAQELGVKKASNLAHDALIYAILDQQAIVTSVDKKEDKQPKKQRARITKTVVTDEAGIGGNDKKNAAPANKKIEQKAVAPKDENIVKPLVVERQEPKKEAKKEAPAVAPEAQKPNKKNNKKEHYRMLRCALLLLLKTTQQPSSRLRAYRGRSRTQGKRGGRVLLNHSSSKLLQ